MKENEHTINALLRKRAELAGEIDHLSGVVQQKHVELAAVDATLRIFVPDIDLETVKPRTVPPRHQALPGEMTRGILSILRETKTPLTSHDVTIRMMRLRQLNTKDLGLVRAMGKRVIACLGANRRRGHLRSIETAGQTLLWEIAR